MKTAERVLQAVRTMGVEEMWEVHSNPALSGIKSLAERLGARSEEPYPQGAYSGRCDLVISDGQNETWLECKFAWTYNVDSKPGDRNSSYRKHLLTDPKESALKDVRQKLPSLVDWPGVDRIAFLLVAFHSVQLPLPESDIAELETKGGLNSEPWHRAVEPDWVNPRNPDCRIRAFYWERLGQTT